MANVGDIVFIGYNGLSTVESFAFVVKNALAANDTIKFTDGGITSAAGNALRSGEFAVQWDVPASGVPAGTVVVITNWRPSTVAVPVGSTISFNGPGGTTSVTDPNTVGTLTLSVETQTNGGLSNSGDQIFAYTGTLAAATVLAGLTASAAPITTGTPTTNTTYAPLPGVPFTALGLFNAKTNFVNNPGAQTIANLTNPANFTTSAGAANATFTDIVPGSIVVATPTVNLGVSTNTGSEANTTIVTVTATASSAVTGVQTVDLGVAGTGITVGDYNLSANQISIADGATSGNVTFTVVNDLLVEGLETAALTISNQTSGITLGSTVAQNIDITDNDVATLGLTVTQGTFSEGAGVNASVATLTRNTDTSNTLTVSLSIDDTSEASAPSSVSFGAGSSTVSFNISAVDDSIFDGSQSLVLTASKSGFTSGTANLTVTDDEVPTLTVSVVGNSFSEAAGTNAALGTVTRTGSAFDLSTPLQVNITSSDVSEATVGNPIFPNPGIVTIAAGESSANFAVNAVDDSILDGSQAVMITAAATGFANSTANLTVNDNDLGFTVNRSSFSEGAGFEAAIGTLTRSDTSNTFTVSLSIDDSSEVSVPTSVSFGFGEDSVNFVINAVDDSIVDGPQNVVLTATANGFATVTKNLTVTDNETIPYKRNNFGTDQKSDVLWRNSSTGEAYLYQMNGFSVASEGSLGVVGNEWAISGTGDLNGDGRADIVWRNSNNNSTYAWLMDGTNRISEGVIREVSAEWELSGTGDFNGDSKSDIVWRNSTSGDTYIYLMDGLSVVGEGTVTNKNADWKIAGTGDFNGDQKSDLLWRNSATGETNISLIDGAFISSESLLTTKSTDLKIEGVDDFDNNGKSDILWRSSTTGETSISLVNGITVATESTIGEPYTTPDHKQSYWSITGTGDYNGDSKADILWSNSDNGLSYIWNMDGLALINEGGIRQNLSSWQVAAPTV
jgi:Calx-beta domain